MVEVFKTSVSNELTAQEIRQELLRQQPDYKINFDLDDCDKILRVESQSLNADDIIRFLQTRGVTCEVLEG